MGRHIAIRSYHLQDLRVPFCAAAVLLLCLGFASSASAQPLTQGQGPNLGTWTYGPIDLQLQASGGAGNGTYVWSLLNGVLPPGLAIRTDHPSYYPANANAGILGVATTPGTYSFTLRVASGGQTTDQTYTWIITSLVDNDQFTLPDGFVGNAYSYQLHALNNVGAVTFTSTTTLPAGMSLSGGGLLSGIPTKSGNFSINFSITDGSGTTFSGRGLNVFDVDIPTSGNLPNAMQGQSYSTTISATGGAGGYTFAACPGNTGGINCTPGLQALPTGLTLDPSSGTISGMVTAGAGHFGFTVTATDSNHVSYSKLMDIVVVGDPPTLPTIEPYGVVLSDPLFGTFYSTGISIFDGGTAPFTWSATGLPAGMSIRTGSGVASSYIAPGDAEIFGVANVLGTFNVQVTATDAQGVSTTNTFPLHIGPLWQRDFLPNGTINVPYSGPVRVYGGQLPYGTTMLESGQLPAGLTFNGSAVTGTPLENSQFNFSFNALFLFTDAVGNTLQSHNYFNVSAGTSTVDIQSGPSLGTRSPNVFTSTQLTACCSPFPFVWSQVGGTVPPGTMITSGGFLVGTPTTEGTYSFLVQATDSTNSANVGIRQLTLEVTSLSTSTSSPLPVANVGATYSVPIVATGGTPPYTFAFTTPISQLGSAYPPPGLTISNTGVLNGPITAPGQFNFSVDIRDSGGRLITRFFSIAVYPAGVTPPLNLNIPSTFGPLLIGSFVEQLTTTGGQPPYHYSATPGTTPITGMRVQDGEPLPTFFTATGGYLGVLENAGVFPTSIRVTDSTGAFFDRPITLTVSPIAIASQGGWPHGAVGVPYSFSLAAVGGTGPYSFALNSFSALPPGLGISAQGQISGMPTVAGNYSFTIVLTDLATSNTINQGFSVTIDPFNITTEGVLPVGTVGTMYSQPMSAPGCGSPCTWTLSSVNYDGLTLSSSGVLSGTATAPINSSFTVQAAGPGGTVQKAMSLEIVATTVQPLVITTTTEGPNVVGSTVANGLFAAGGTPPYAFSLQSGTLPPGITLQTPGETIGALLSPGFSFLAGRAMQVGTFTFTLAVTDAANATATRTLTWKISRLFFDYPGLPVSGPLINNPLVYNTPYTQPLLFIGGTGSYTFANLTAMPPGLALDPNTGIVSGTPTNTGSTSTQIQATDSAGNTQTNFISFNVSGPTSTILGFSSGPSLGTVSEGNSFNFNVTPTGGTPPYTVTALSALPAGFAVESGDSLLSFASPGSFFVSGVPFGTGPFSFTLQGQDSAGNVGVRTFTGTVVPYTVFNQTLHDGSVGVPYSQTLIVEDGSTVTWTPLSTAPLPNALNVSSGGVISGTPQAAGIFSFTLTATDSVTQTTRNFGFSLRISQIAIGDPLILPKVAVVGQPFSYSFTGTGGASEVWSATGLPNGLAISPTGTISGTSSQAGEFAVVVTVTDGVVPAVQRFTLFIQQPNPTEFDFPVASTTLADVTMGQSMSTVLLPNGGVPPYQAAVANGSTLPAGLQLTVADANLPTFPPGSPILLGAPTGAGLHSFDIVFTDSAQPADSVQRTFTLNVSPLNILSGSSRTATMGAPYDERFLVVGGTPPYQFSITPFNLGQPTLPPGISPSSSGVLSGTSTSTGNYTFNLHVQDASGNTFTRTNTLVVNSPTGLRITNGDPADDWVGSGRSIGLFTSGSSTYTFSVVGGTMPPGVSLVTSGSSTNLAGAPSTAGTFVFTLRATDNASPTISADRTFTWHIAPFQVVSPTDTFNVTALPSANLGVPYSFTFAVAGGTPPYTASQSPFTPLPPGLGFNGLVLSGTPTATGNFAIVPIITDSKGQTLNESSHNLVVAPPGAAEPLVDTLGVTSPLGVGSASVGVPFVLSLVEWQDAIRGGTAPFTWVVTPGSTLPPGELLLPGGNGISNLLGGVPTTPGSYAFSLTVSDAGGQTLTVPFVELISTLALTPSGLMLQPGMVGAPYALSFLPSGGVAPYAMQLGPASDLPPGLSMDASGHLAGTPTAPGLFLLRGTLTDSNGSTLKFIYGLPIDDALGEAPGLSVAPNPIQVYYTTGSPAPAAVPVSVDSTSGNLPFEAIVTGIPGATLTAGSGTTSSSVALNFNVAGLGVGTYGGVFAASAPNAVNRFVGIPVTLTIASPPPCSIGVNPSGATIQATGGSGSFSVSAGPGCAWTTTGPPPSLVQITAGANGTGNGLVTYSVTPNTSPNARTLTISVVGQPYTITQFGTACSFGISPATFNAPAAGGTVGVTVTASDVSCGWTATSTSLGLDTGGGTGNGIVNVTIPPNAGAAPLTLTATIGARVFKVVESGVACTVGLSPYSASSPAEGGQGSFGVQTPAGCNYDTTAVPSWVSVTSGGSGSGPGTLVYTVAPNSTTAARSGTIVTGGQSFQITQAAEACSVSLNTAGLGSPYGPAGGAGVIGITTNGPNCSWTASSADSWATVLPASGTGNGSLGVTIQSNAASLTGRSTTLTIAGTTVSITQSGTACTYSLQSSTGTVPAAGGTGTVGVIAPAVCTWTATNTDPWATITAAGDSGTSDVQFSVQPNTAATSRMTTLSIAGLTYTITQAPAPCSYSFSAPSVTVGPDGVNNTPALTFNTTTAGCSAVPAVSYASWITANTALNGASGSVTVTIGPNPATTNRTGTVRVGDQNFTVTQSGAVCGYILNAYSALFGPGGSASASLLGSPSALGCTPAVGTDQPSFVTLGTLLGPTQDIFTLPYSIAPFNLLTLGVRTANITFGGQILKVKQTSQD